MSGINRKTGRVKFFNSTKGYGFIIPDDQAGKSNIEDLGLFEAEVFVHHTAIHNNGGFKSLAEGEEVEYDLVQGAKGMQAANVTGPGGAPVQGDPNASFRQYQNGGRTTGSGSGGNGGSRPYGGNVVEKNQRVKVSLLTGELVAFMDPYGAPAYGYPGLPYVLPPGFQYGQQQYPIYRYTPMGQQAPPLTSPEQQPQTQPSQQPPTTSPMLFAGYPPGMGYNPGPAYPPQRNGSPQPSNGSPQNQ
ncbi:Y box binding protein 1 [Apophysomyces ossiformis]|uniref:Y box binding protein 1 n=1 Tax=Apophysomyces ossiformis TaxID=679940 RepID=A0A8H7BI63_9FUNG|nr:Y box binding protein 1 [Apophysomyces ossiformis]